MCVWLVGHYVQIVRDGELLVGDDGSLLLSPVGTSGSGDLELNPDSDLGSGNGGNDLLKRSLSPSSQTLPPLPAHVEMVNFTWIAYTTVSPQCLYYVRRYMHMHTCIKLVPSHLLSTLQVFCWVRIWVISQNKLFAHSICSHVAFNIHNYVYIWALCSKLQVHSKHIHVCYENSTFS